MYLTLVDDVIDGVSFIHRFFSGIVDVVQIGVAGLLAFVDFIVVGFKKFMDLFNDFFNILNGADFSVKLILGVAGFTVIITLAKYFASVFFKG